MSLIAADELERLLTPQSECCLSITMPCHQSGAKVRQNAIRFKNLLSEAKQQSFDCEDTLKGVFKSLDRLVGDDQFWQHQQAGLAVYADGHTMSFFRLPISFAEHASVGLQFLLMPLLPAIAEERAFYVLCVSRNRTRLLQCDGATVSEVPTDMPEDWSAYHGNGDEEKAFGLHSFRVRSGNGESAVPHGHPEADDEAELTRYFRDIDEAVREAVPDPTTPLVFAADEPLFSVFKEASQYDGLVGECLAGNYDRVADDEVAEKAFEIVRPQFEAKVAQRLKSVNDRASQGLVFDDLKPVVAAAEQGAVDLLFVNEERFLKVPPGADMESGVYQRFCELERAVRGVVHHGGQVVAVASGRLGGRDCLAGLRYPINEATVAF